MLYELVVCVCVAAQVALTTSSDPECLPSSSCSSTNTGCVDQGRPYEECFDSDASLRSPHHCRGQDLYAVQCTSLGCPSDIASSNGGELNLTITSVNPDEYDLIVRWDTQGGSARHCLQVDDDHNPFNKFCTCSDQGHATISSLKYGFIENTYTVKLVNLSDHTAVRTSLRVPRSCRDGRIQFSARHCGPPLYKEVQQLTVTSTRQAADEALMDSLISWLHPPQSQSYGPPQLYYITVTYHNAAQCNLGDPNCFIFIFVTNQTSVTVTNLNSSQAYTFKVQPYVPCSAMEGNQGGNRRDEKGCGYFVKITTSPPTEPITMGTATQTDNLPSTHPTDTQQPTTEATEPTTNPTSTSYSSTYEPTTSYMYSPSETMSTSSEATSPRSRITTTNSPTIPPPASISSSVYAPIAVTIVVLVITLGSLTVLCIVVVIRHRNEPSSKLHPRSLDDATPKRTDIEAGGISSSSSSTESQESITLQIRNLLPCSSPSLLFRFCPAEQDHWDGLVVYSPRTPQEDVAVIEEKLIRLPYVTHRIKLASCDYFPSNISEFDWVMKEIPSAKAVFCVINKEFQEDFNGKGSNQHPLVLALRNHVPADLAKFSNKYAVVTLRHRYHEFIPELLLNCKSIDITDTDRIACFAMGEPSVTLK